MSDQPYLLRVPEAAKLLGLKKSKVYDMAKQNLIPAVRFGRYVRIPRKDLEQWVNEQVDGNRQRWSSSL
jgi:excisionase family DNA binding protein